MRDKKTKMLTMGAVYTALSVILLFLAATVPMLELTFLALASAMPAIMILEAGPLGGVLVYIATSILGFAIIPNKIMVFPYIFLFGLYGIVKYLAEKPKSAVLQMSIKILFFSISFTIFRNILLKNDIFADMITVVIFGISIVICILYDYIFTMGLCWYRAKIQNRRR